MYGWAKAHDDAHTRGIRNPTAIRGGWTLKPTTPGPATPHQIGLTLEGMAAYFGSINATTGLYSTTTQWSQLVGSVPPTSPRYSLDSQLAGAKTTTAAKRNCSASPLTAGGRVPLTPYVSGGWD
jgi:hypothetical protein